MMKNDLLVLIMIATVSVQFYIDLSLKQLI